MEASETRDKWEVAFSWYCFYETEVDHQHWDWFLCAAVLFSGLGVWFCFSFLLTLMPSRFSMILLIRCVCVWDPPDPCPGRGTGTAQEMWQRGSLLSFGSQQCRKLPLWVHTCRHQTMVPFWDRGFAVPVPIPRLAGRMGGCSRFQPVLRYQTGAACAPVLTSHPWFWEQAPQRQQLPLIPGKCSFCSWNTSWRQQLFFSPSPFKACRQSVEGSLFQCRICRQLLSSMGNLAGSAVMHCQLSKLQGALG